MKETMEDPGEFSEPDMNDVSIPPKNILWIDTFLWSFECDMEKANIGHVWRSKQVEILDIEYDFFLQICKLSARTFSLALHRRFKNQNKKPDPGYFFSVSFSVVGSCSVSRSTDMQFDSNVASVPFNLEDFCDGDKENGLCVIKCVINMHENTCLRNKNRKEQEKMLQKKLKDIRACSPEQYELMASLLQRPKLKGIFSGRQRMKFAEMKSDLLQRSLHFSKDLVVNLRNFVGDQEEDIKLRTSLMLGYIFSGEMTFIEKRECLLLFVQALYYGLFYLAVDCMIYIFRNLDETFVIDVLIVSFLTGNRTLLSLTLGYVLGIEKTLIKTDRWKNLRNNYNKLYCSLMNSFYEF